MSRLKKFVPILALVVVLAGIAASATWAFAFSDDSCDNTKPCRPPEGVVGSPYTHSLKAMPNSGNGPPYSFHLQGGALPSGLSLNSSTGLISGTPTGAGPANFGVELQDNPEPTAFWCKTPPGDCPWREFTINVLSGISINNQTAKPGTLGQAYSEPLTATAVTTLNPPTGTQAVGATWSVFSGTLPPGVNLGADGLLSGTPTTEGSFAFVVRAQLDPQRWDTETLTISIRQPLVIQPAKPLSTAGAPTLWEVGVPFAAKLGASGGTGTYTWSLADGALPTGLALAADGTLIGKPSAAGVSRATIRLTDTEGRTADYPANFGVASRLAISTLKLRPGRVGRLYRAKLATSGGIPLKKWKVTTGPLPRGVRLDRALGVLSGTPTKPGRYRVTFGATDALKVTASKTLVITVLA